MLSPEAGNPFFTVSIAVFALILSAYPVMRLIGWWMDGAIEPVMALFSILLYIGLVCMAMAAPPGVAFLIFLLIIASAVITPVLGKLSEQKQLTQMEDDRFMSYSLALEKNPMDPAARIAVAEELHRRGRREEAIEHLTWTLEHFPALSFRIKQELDSWKREKEREGMLPPVICHLCSAENLPGATVCERCGAQFGTKAGILERIQQEGGPKIIIRGWIITASVVILIGVVVLFGLPAIIAGPIILGGLIVGAWVFLRWLGGDLGKVVEEPRIPSRRT